MARKKKVEKTEEVKSTEIVTPVEQMDREATSQWLVEREKGLTPEERAEAERNQERYELLGKKGRLVMAVGICESPDEILKKMSNGLRELARLPVDLEMLDRALSTQSERFRVLADFFLRKTEATPNEKYASIAVLLAELHEKVEAFRLAVLQTGDKAEILGYAECAEQLAGVIQEQWKKEDGNA